MRVLTYLCTDVCVCVFVVYLSSFVGLSQKEKIREIEGVKKKSLFPRRSLFDLHAESNDAEHE